MHLKPELLEIIENVPTAPAHFRMRLASKRLAREARPGQFVQITVTEHQYPFLPRPFSFLQTGDNWFDILYQVVGRGTEILSRKKKGEMLNVLGPLGQGWRLPASKSKKAVFVLVGGGVGIPPLYHWAQELIKSKKVSPSRIRVFLGGRSSEFLHCEKDFLRLGLKPAVATDDGSKGHHGFVTKHLEDFLSLESAQIYTCGPTPMLKAVSAIAQKHAMPCQVSVEEPMPCGFGVCLGCAIKVKDSKDGCGHRFALSCTEGPVFNASEVLWS